MTARISRITAFLSGLALFGGAIYGFYVLVTASIRVFRSLDSDIAVAVIAGAATVFVSVLSVILGKIYERRAAVDREHRERKVPVYEDLMQFMFRVLMSDKLGKEVSEQEMIEFISSFNQRMMVWGSDEVLKAWSQWRRKAGNGGEPFALMFEYERLILAIRADLGHRNKNLSPGDILGLFVNDIDEHTFKARS